MKNTGKYENTFETLLISLLFCLLKKKTFNNITKKIVISNNLSIDNLPIFKLDILLKSQTTTRKTMKNVMYIKYIAESIRPENGNAVKA